MDKGKTWVKLAWIGAVVLWVAFFISLILVRPADAQYEHEFFTGDQFGVRWDESTLALGYHWHVQRDDGVIVIQDSTTELSVSLNISSAGTYVFHIRAWNLAPDGETVKYSGWATSLTHGVVDGTVQPWHIKIKLKPVGPLFIDDGYGP